MCLQKDAEQALVVAISCSAVLDDDDDGGQVHRVGVAFPLLQVQEQPTWEFFFFFLKFVLQHLKNKKIFFRHCRV